jgi:DNA polymerase I-like protein with 3'-5' exonuclease and polymerase domains
LNTLLQGAGAIVMKQALVHLSDRLKNIPHRFVANVHDEWQIETTAHYADTVGRIGVRAIRIAGETLSLRCPLDGEYRVGNNWAETH